VNRNLAYCLTGFFVLLVSGCGSENYSLSYSLSKPVREMTDQKKQDAVVRALSELYGPSPREIKIPEGLGLKNGGYYLANFAINKGETEALPLVITKTDGNTQIAGGYGLYRKHCLHCHGVSGDGNGPTADYLYPRPRDYRKGLYKFTSTAAGAKPSREDLWKTINYGLHGTSMPGFEALMTPAEIEQVIDYVVFLSIRGETELLVAQDVSDGAWDEQIGQETGPSTNPWFETPSNSKIYQPALETAKMVAEKWNNAESQVFNPPVPRVSATNDSVLRGRELFLGYTKERLECWGCHGLQAAGNGKSFVDKKLFEKVMFSKQVFQGIYSDEDRSKAILEATASRLAEEKDERSARLAALGIGGHHGGHSGGEHGGERAPLTGWSATLTASTAGFAPTDEERRKEIRHELESTFPGLMVEFKTDAKAEKPTVTIKSPAGVRQQILNDLNAEIPQALLAHTSGIGDGKGWQVVYRVVNDVASDAPDSQKQLSDTRSHLIAESVAHQLNHRFPGLALSVQVTADAKEPEIEVVPVNSADSDKTEVVKALLLDSAGLVKSYFGKIQTDWTGSLDDWQWPLRPANLNTGIYKGGRRPIDIYWRIAKGINGAKMPAHETTLKPEQIWDLVNFVLALPDRPELLRDATEPVRNDAAPAKLANN